MRRAKLLEEIGTESFRVRLEYCVNVLRRFVNQDSGMADTVRAFFSCCVSEFRRSRKSEVPLRGLAFYGVRDASLATEDFQGMRPRIPWGQNAGKTAPRHDPTDQIEHAVRQSS